MTKHFPRLLLVMSFAALSVTQACSCDPSTGEPPCELPSQVRNGMCCPAPTDTGMLCGLGEICQEGSVVYDPNDTLACNVVCNMCVPNFLPPGVLSQQLDITQTAPEGGGAGTVTLSGYSPGDSETRLRYGDLVVGEYDATMDEVEWEIIDGVPPGPSDGFYSPLGWRDGKYEPGDDVGRYSSIVASGETLYVSYEDTTHRSLKIAIRRGGTWSTHTIEDITDTAMDPSGGALYTSIALDANGAPVIAYGVRLRPTDAMSQPTGLIRIAHAADDMPTSSDDWSFTNLNETLSEIGCVQTSAAGDNICHPDQTCVNVGTTGRGRCVPTAGTGTCTGCGSRQICVDSVCTDPKTLGDLSDDQGLYNNLVRVADGFALAFYDRSVTRPAETVSGNITVTQVMMGMTTVEVGGDRLVRTSGAPLNMNMIGRPVEITGVPGRRTVTGINGSQLIFSGPPVPFTDGMAVASTAQLYQSTGGTVWGMRFPDADADWSDNARFAIEGYAANPLHGDCGISTSLFVDPTGVWHLAFVDGSLERLRYARVATNNTVTGRGTVDDGYPAGHRPADRPMLGGERRLVGDGASIVVTSDGEIRITYQDTTRIYPVIARCSGANCTRAPLACLVDATCVANGAGSTCNQGFCSESSWVSTAAFTLPEDMNMSPNAGYYTVQILDALDGTLSIAAWLERQLQPSPDEGWTEVDTFGPPTP